MVERRDEEDLDSVTERELRSLAHERPVPEDLERRVVRNLRDEGLLASKPSSSRGWLQAAASVFLVALGFAAGAWWMRPAPVSIDQSGPPALVAVDRSGRPAVLTLDRSERQSPVTLDRSRRPAPVAIDRSGPRFLLLLHETPSSQASSPEGRRVLVEEYKTWATDGARKGFLLEGEKLKEERMMLPEIAGVGAHADGSPGPIGGYFVICAANYEQALRLARTCPHLLHGGRIEVREIDPV